MDIRFDSLFCFTYLKDYEFIDFTHNTHELIYFINGEGSIIINGTLYTYMPHTICFTHAFDKRTCHCFKNTDYICIRFTTQSPLTILGSGVYQTENETLYTLFKQVCYEYSLKANLFYEYCNTKIMEILILLSRVKQQRNKGELSMLHLIKDIDNNPCFALSVREMAASVSYSYDHFRHKFKQLTGLPPADYVLNKKIENACQFLLNKDLSCTEISEICGFSSPSQFSTLFRRKVGISPKQYIAYKHLK